VTVNVCIQGLLLLHEVPERHRTVLGDEIALKRIIINLVRYGVHHSFTAVLSQELLLLAIAIITGATVTGST
jgi:hypothetical protein